MDPFSITVGVVTIIDSCKKMAEALMQVYQDYVTVESDIAEILLMLKSTWHRTEIQMDFLKRIWASLDPDYQNGQILLLSKLESEFQIAINLLHEVIGKSSEPSSLNGLLVKKGKPRRHKFVFGVKASLKKTLSKLWEWRAEFDPSWYILAKIGNHVLDRELGLGQRNEPLRLLAALRKSVQDLKSDNTHGPPTSISSRDFVGARRVISSSPLLIGPIEGRTLDAIIDTMMITSNMNAAGTTGCVNALAEALSRMNPSTSNFGLLRCCGVIDKIDKYEFVFVVPHEFTSPRSLRDLLISPEPSLNMKVELARQLARSVLYLHATGFVHKNIRPEAILVFDHSGGGKSLFLCGFENFRGVQEHTFKVSDGSPERDLYRHPMRQGNDPEKSYVMQHDIYSLGVLLLEIGLWRSFVKYKEGDAEVAFGRCEYTKDIKKRAFAIKKEMLLLAAERMPHCMGSKYAAIVERCLDVNAKCYQKDDTDVYETKVALEFFEDVLRQLHEIVV